MKSASLKPPHVVRSGSLQQAITEKKPEALVVAQTLSNEDHFKSRDQIVRNHLHSSSLLANKNNSMADLCNTPSFDPGSNLIESDFGLSSHIDNRLEQNFQKPSHFKRDQKD